MNGLLAVTGAFLERMTNPQYGIDVNEEHSFRLHQALTDDPEFARSLATLALDPEDVESLPVCAWPWYLQWRQDHGTPLSVDFLDALFDHTDDPAVRLSVVQSAVFPDYPETGPGTAPAGGSTARGDHAPGDAEQEPRRPARSPWLLSRTARMISPVDPARGTEDASEIASYLLQLGDPESLESLRALIGRPGAGRESLVATIGRHISEANLDRGTEARWRAQLGLPAPREQA